LHRPFFYQTAKIMSLRHMLSYAQSLTPSSMVAKAGVFLARHAKAWCQARLNAGRCTYGETAKLSQSPFRNISLADTFNLALPSFTRDTLAHRFDLLGSGPVTVGAPSPHTAQLSRGNRKRSKQIRSLISENYAAIDWQLDFRSGFRWRSDQWSAGILYGHEPGVDIKVPWELARLQHLPLLALAGQHHECRDQILDFIAANPPGYGVNWVCTMDVAIRAANMALTQWLLKPDNDVFEAALAASLLSHGRHIMANLEDAGGFRGNHYLADVCGLAFIAAALQPTDETTAWWRFAVGQVFLEIATQFNADGTNFEASTSYHRLSAEMVVYTVALILNRDGADDMPDDLTGQLYRMAQFSRDATKPNGRVVQIGDNDSGRFFKFNPGEDDLDHQGLITAIGALIGDNVEPAAESHIVSTLAAGRTLQMATPPALDRSVQRAPGKTSNPGRQIETQIQLPNADVLDDLATVAYPNFGLFIWKSARVFLSIRCGPIGQNGRGGHAHNDQLSVELNIEGEDWLADPGSYVYTADPKRRDAYRSVMAHAAPRMGTSEPAGLNLGMFRLEDRAQAQCLEFGSNLFEGRHLGFGTPTHRGIKIETGTIRVRDSFCGTIDWQADAETTIITTAEELRRHFGMTLPFSPSYGLLDES
jgi:hypothetical protein